MELQESPPSGVVVVKGERPGIRMGHRRDEVSGGPTGAPWVDSNGWRIRLTATRNPGKTLWVTAEPRPAGEIVPAQAQLIAVADAGAHGARWVLEPEGDIARLAPALRFFATHADWNLWQPLGVIGVLSDFSGQNEFLSQELLNLTARLNQPYRILDRAKFTPPALSGLKAVVYPDSDAPPAALRRELLRFAEGGGVLIAGPQWGAAKATFEDHPRYLVQVLGKGRLAVAREEIGDPYLAAADAQILLSHRHDLVRFFNGGTVGSYYTASPDGRRGLLHIVNFAGRAGRDPMSVRVAGSWRAARLHTFEAVQPLESVPERGALDVRLPPVAVYAAIELEA